MARLAASMKKPRTRYSQDYKAEALRHVRRGHRLTETWREWAEDVIRQVSDHGQTSAAEGSRNRWEDRYRPEAQIER